MGAEVFQAEVLVGVTPLEVKLPLTQKTYSLRARHKGYKTTDADCALTAGGGPSSCLVKLPRLSPTLEKAKVIPKKGIKPAKRMVQTPRPVKAAEQETPKPKIKEKPKIHMIDE